MVVFTPAWSDFHPALSTPCKTASASHSSLTRLFLSAGSPVWASDHGDLAAPPQSLRLAADCSPGARWRFSPHLLILIALIPHRRLISAIFSRRFAVLGVWCSPFDLITHDLVLHVFFFIFNFGFRFKNVSIENVIAKEWSWSQWTNAMCSCIGAVQSTDLSPWERDTQSHLGAI